MEKLWNIDWATMFLPQHSVLELMLRGTIMYLVIFVLLRIVLRRQVGGIGRSDILVIVLIAEVAGNGMSSEYKSVVEGAMLVATMLFWSYVVEWLQFRIPSFERLVREPKLKLIDNGRLLTRNMRAEFVTPQELMAQLRENGLEAYSDVKAAYIEADGHISVIRHQKDDS